MTTASMRKQIAILLPDLGPGGAERMRLQMAARWLDEDLEVEFVLQQAQGQLLALLPAGANVVDLKATRARNVLPPLISYLRHSSPDALLAAMWPLTAVAPIAARLARYRGSVVISEHSPLSRAYIGRGSMHRLALRASTALGYRLADARIGVSSGVTDDMAALSGLPCNRFRVVHNPAALGQVTHNKLPLPAALQTVTGPLVLSVGTLKVVKRHDLLIDAFARLPDELGATLCILGEGQERPALERQVVALGLSGRVLMPGFASDTAPWYGNADLFVLSSDYEGFGNVIVEALEHGVPVISTDCPSGPVEILEGGVFGDLVPVGDVGALAQAMHHSLSREHDSESLKRRAAEFSVDKAADAYLELLFPDRLKAACS